MKLYEAKMKARQGIQEVLDKNKITMEQVKEYAAKHPKYSDPLRKYPVHEGISVAANLSGR